MNNLIGKTVTRVSGEVGGDELIFYCSDGTSLKFYHDQDCCEQVYIEDIIGDLNDLLGDITYAEEVSSDDAPDPEYEYESYTWTFYKFATINGWVDVRWFGTSNGYYSEGVSWEWS